jgi:hypothetical protein
MGLECYSNKTEKNYMVIGKTEDIKILSIKLIFKIVKLSLIAVGVIICKTIVIVVITTIIIIS